jgi:hypothetical protein
VNLKLILNADICVPSTFVEASPTGWYVCLDIFAKSCIFFRNLCILICTIMSFMAQANLDLYLILMCLVR